MISRPIVIAFCVTLLVGCSEEEALRSCKRQVEPAVVVRHLSLPPQKKTELDSCFASPNLKPEFCRATYLDADELVSDCMSDKGYSFATIHSPTDYADAKCYKATWLVKFESLLRTSTNRATSPVFSKCEF